MSPLRRVAGAAAGAVLVMHGADACAAPVAAQTSPAAPPQASSAAAQDGTTSASVLVSTDAGLEVWTGTHVWMPICAAPCNQLLPLDRTYRATVDGTRSSPFHLEGSAGQNVRVDVSAPSKQVKLTGLALVLLGSATVVGGFTAMLATENQGPCVGSCASNGPQNDTSAEIAGGVVAAIGAAAMIGGLVLFALNHGPRISQFVSTSASAPMPARIGAAWTPMPTPRDLVRDVAPASPRVGMPILRAEF